MKTILALILLCGLTGCMSKSKQFTNCSASSWGTNGPGYSYTVFHCDQGDIQINLKTDPFPKGQPAPPSIIWGAEPTKP